METNEIFPNDRKRWRNQRHIYAASQKSYIEFAEIKFLTDSFNSLPIEKRKELLSFSMIDPFDNKQLESESEAEYRERLRYQNYIEFNAEIII